MKKQQTIMLAAGGTGGHVFPAQAVAELAIAQGITPIMVLDKRGNAFLPQNLPGVKKIILNIRTNNGGLLWLSQMLMALLIMIYKIARHRPAAILGFGGFPSLPTALAAWLWQVPIVLCEQNRVLGRTNRFLAPLSKKIALAFADTQKLSPRYVYKTVITGIPLRHNILTAKAHKLSPDKRQILIIGGSQGAAIFSQVVPQAISQLPTEEQQQLAIIQQARPELLKVTTDAYAASQAQITIAPFFTNIGDLLAGSDLLICRAGASTVTEISHIGIPTIFVPYPWATDNHQHYNAAYLADKEAAILIPEQEFTATKLANILQDFLQNPQRFKDMAAKARDPIHTQAAQSLLDLLVNAGNKALS